MLAANKTMTKASTSCIANPNAFNSKILIESVVSEDMLMEALKPTRRSWTRITAASHECATPAVLEKSLCDCDERVALAALGNKNTPEDLLFSILNSILEKTSPDGYVDNGPYGLGLEAAGSHP